MSYDREKYQADLAAKRWCQFVPEHERPVLTGLLKAILANGWSVSIYNGGDEHEVEKSTELNLLRSRLGLSGEDKLYTYAADGTHNGWWYLIYNNGSEDDPMIVICDYTVDKDEDLCPNERIWKALDAKYGS